MLNRVLEIAEENRYISLDRGFIVIESKGEELGRIPLDDVAVLLSAQSITLTKKHIQCNLSLYTIKNYIGCIITDQIFRSTCNVVEFIDEEAIIITD